MLVQAQQRLLHRLRRAVAAGPPHIFADEETYVPARAYFDPERYAKERALLHKLPLPIAMAADVAEPRTVVARDDAGVPLILTRDDHGTLRAFRNACRHRGVRLLDDEAPCRRKALVCPYHAWTYALDGRLQHVPLRKAFPTLPLADRGLVEVACSERYGLVWVTVDPDAPHDVDRFVGPLAPELEELDLARYVVYRRTARSTDANWKFLIDAFLENYHVRRLHRNTVGEFFYDGVSVFDSVGPHMRTATARKALAEADASAHPSSMMTMSYHLAPWTMLILHPGFISRLTVIPTAVDKMRFTHEMLIPAEHDTPDRAEHWRRSFALIDGGVFASEDIMIAERSQAGLAAEANETFAFGGLETPAVVFHGILEQMIAAPALALDADRFTTAAATAT